MESKEQEKLTSKLVDHLNAEISKHFKEASAEDVFASLFGICACIIDELIKKGHTSTALRLINPCVQIINRFMEDIKNV